MLTKEDINAIERRGSSEERVRKQIERFKTGFPWLDIVAPATPERGIEVLEDDEIEDIMDYVGQTQIDSKCKFVPASGAASRMFKDIFAGQAALSSGEDVPSDSAAARLAASIEKFAF